MNEKELTESAQEKMLYDDSFLVFPTAMKDVALELHDMDDGLGGYLTPNELESLSNNNWKILDLTDGLSYCMYSFDYDDEISDVTNTMIGLGLIDIRNGRKINSITYDELVDKGFVICSKREMNLLQRLVSENRNYGVLND